MGLGGSRHRECYLTASTRRPLALADSSGLAKKMLGLPGLVVLDVEDVARRVVHSGQARSSPEDDVIGSPLKPGEPLQPGEPHFGTFASYWRDTRFLPVTRLQVRLAVLS